MLRKSSRAFPNLIPYSVSSNRTIVTSHILQTVRYEGQRNEFQSRILSQNMPTSRFLNCDLEVTQLNTWITHGIKGQVGPRRPVNLKSYLPVYNGYFTPESNRARQERPHFLPLWSDRYLKDAL